MCIFGCKNNNFFRTDQILVKKKEKINKNIEYEKETIVWFLCPVLCTIIPKKEERRAFLFWFY
jgi:hypothetical protein